MFSQWIRILLKLFDICGFYTESSIASASRKHVVLLFVFHIVWTCVCSYFIIRFSMQPPVMTDVLPFSINYFIQHLSAMFAYWMITVESFVQRSAQRQFWKIYEHVQNHRRDGKQPLLRSYLIKLIEYFVVITLVQIYFMHYFTKFVQNLLFFRISYFIFVMVCQYRVFYFLLYLEIIKIELQNIKSELKRIVNLSQFDRTFSIRSNKRVNPRTNRVDSKMRNFVRFNLIRINEYYRLIFELGNCTNDVFGWSNITTILFCFHLLITDGNWALWAISQRPAGYTISTFCFAFRKT